MAIQTVLSENLSRSTISHSIRYWSQGGSHRYLLYLKISCSTLALAEKLFYENRFTRIRIYPALRSWSALLAYHSLIINTKINQWPYSYGAAAKRPSFENATDADDGYLLKAEEAFDDFHRLSHDTWYLNILGLDSLQFGANKRDINISGGPERFGLISKDSTEEAGSDAVPVR